MRPRLKFSPAQVRAGRALRGPTAEQLAAVAGLEPEAIELYEHGEGELSPAEHSALGEALYADGEGVIAIPANYGGEGVRLARAPDPARHAAFVLAEASTSPLRGSRDGDW